MAADTPWFKRLPLLVIGAALLLSAALVISRLEWVEEEVDLGPSTEAKRNPFLASQRLLERYDLEHASLDGFGDLSTRLAGPQASVDTSDSLILINTFQSLREEQVGELWHWLERGGRLIVSLENPAFGSGAHLHDPLLARVGATLHTSEEFHLHEFEASNSAGDDNPAELPTSEPDVAAEAKAESEAACRWGQSTVAAHLGEHEPEISVGVSGATYMRVHDPAAQILAGTQEAAYVLRREVGAGEVYVITSPTAWRNSNIGCGDNAYFFWRLAATEGKVWYAQNREAPSLWHHLWQLSAVGCAALLLALAAWLWTRATRFGPLLSTQESARRQFVEHLGASAQFMRRHGGNGLLIDILQTDIAQAAERRHPGFKTLARGAKIQALQRLTAMDPAVIDGALFHLLPATLPTAQLLARVKQLQQLRNRL